MTDSPTTTTPAAEGAATRAALARLRTLLTIRQGARLIECRADDLALVMEVARRALARPLAACEALVALAAAVTALLPELVDVRTFPAEGRVEFCRSCDGTLSIERPYGSARPFGHSTYCRWAKHLDAINAALLAAVVATGGEKEEEVPHA